MSDLPEAVPPAHVADRWLTELGVAVEDRSAILAARSHLSGSPELSALLRERSELLVERMGDPRPIAEWPEGDGDLGPAGSLFHVWVLLTALPAVRAYHSGLGLAPPQTDRALSNLASQLSSHRSLHGAPGLSEQNWLTRHFRGLVIDFSPLHVERTHYAEPITTGTGPRAGEPVLALHIPPGRLDPAACTRAIGAARRFVSSRFPGEYRYAVCTSWVLDPQLREYLPATSNIVRFQERFVLSEHTGPDRTATLLNFAFGRAATDLWSLPGRTALERAVLRHASSGRPWHFRTGWFPLARVVADEACGSRR